MDKKKEQLKSKLILLSNHLKEEAENKEVELTEEELLVKSRLIEIESKIDSIERIIESIGRELPETFYNSEVFFTIIAGSALTAATEIVNEVFGVKGNSEENPLI